MIVVAALVASALGAVVRFLVAKASPAGFPWTVLIVNVVGSAIGGAVLALAPSGDLRLVLLTGFCGGLTTFSTFSVETVQFALEGKWRVVVTSVAANLLLGIGAAALAYTLAS